MSIKNKIVGALSLIIGIMLLSSVFVSFNLKKLNASVESLEKKDFKGITVLLEADRDSYQSNISLVQIFSLTHKEKIKDLTKDVNENLKQVRKRFGIFRSVLENNMPAHQAKFKEFEKYLNNTEKNTATILSLIKKGETQKAKEFYFTIYQKDYDSMRGLIDFFSEQTYTFANKSLGVIDSSISSSFNTFIVISIFTLLIVGVFTYTLRKNLDKSFSNLTHGIVGFFDYLNRKSDDVELLDDSKNDEIGNIAKVVNENIRLSKINIDEDRRVIEEIIVTLGELAKGDLTQRIDINVINPSLNQLKNILNNMASTMQTNIDNILDILAQYSNYNYKNKVDVKHVQKHFLKLSTGINDLNDSITGMLTKNSSTGMTLSKSSLTLLENVESLSKSSNASAVFLEETAAALEQVTSTVIHNTQNVEKISTYATNLQKSSNEGEKLAKDTALSMDEINEQTQAIAEAITVIDQIAFQTNILSLNAAVEAATAGEAGKGFAVVAQEVRNLASRSAEAAKQIKDLVESATVKANQGKVISDKMIEGYHGVNENVNNTLTLIKGIAVSSKEQQSGIEQINNAISDLDQQTQNNASVATLTNDIATQTLEISKEIVKEVNDKNFRGKEEVVSRSN